MAGYGYAYSPTILRGKKAVAAFSPSDLTGLKLWLKSDVGLTFSNSPTNTLVSQWDDQSGNANHAVQATGSNQPLKVDNVLNGKQVLRFDGTNDYMRVINLLTVGTVCIVSNFNAAAFPTYNALLSAIAEPGRHMFFGEPGTNIYNNAPFGGRIYVNGILTQNYAPLATHKIMSGHDTAPFIMTAFIDIGADRLSIGSREWNGDIVEIILYDNVLSTADRIEVENYLTTRYDL